MTQAEFVFAKSRKAQPIAFVIKNSSAKELPKRFFSILYESNSKSV